MSRILGFLETAAPFAAFCAVIYGGLAFELWNGNVAALRVVEERGLEGWTDGSLARAIENDYTEHSAVKEFMRPRQAELLWLTFGEVTPRVTVGRDRWLFETSNVKDYPGEGWEEVVEEHAALIARLARWFEEQGTLLYAVPVPNKWALYPDRLPDLDPKPRAVWRPFLRALEEAGVRAVDLAPALDPEIGASFVANETHWTGAACARSGALVAARIVEDFGDELPGEELRGIISEKEARATRGDLHRMLGFRPGSRIDRSFEVDVAPVVPLVPPPAEGAAPPEFVLCGTSFSDNFRFAGMISVELERRVEDLSVPAQGPLVMLRRLIDDMTERGRPAPAAVVWEIPEKHLFVRQREFLQPMRGLARQLEQRGLWPEANREPLPGFRWRPWKLAIEEVSEGVWDGRPETGDPQLIVDLEEAVPADGSLALCYRVEPDSATTTKVLWDFGGGISRRGTSSAALSRTSGPQLVVMPIEGAPGRSVKRFRIDPVDRLTPFRISDLHLRRRVETEER